MDVEGRRVSRKSFSVQCVGHTNGAHLALISKITGIGHQQVYDNEESDYDLMFCPIVSRVGTDIGEAMTKLRAGKQTILVVMHHTYNSEHTVLKSSRHVDNVDVVLTVDCFFYNGQLLRCQQNNDAWAEIRRCLGAPPSIWVTGLKNVMKWINKRKSFLCKAIFAMATVTLFRYVYNRWDVKKIRED